MFVALSRGSTYRVSRMAYAACVRFAGSRRADTHRRDFDLSCAVRYRCKVLTARARTYARREKSKGTVAVLPFYSKL